MAFRFGALPDSSVMICKLLELSKILMASAAYLSYTPTVASDLAHHSVIIGPARSLPTFSFRKTVASRQSESRIGLL